MTKIDWDDGTGTPTETSLVLTGSVRKTRTYPNQRTATVVATFSDGVGTATSRTSVTINDVYANIINSGFSATPTRISSLPVFNLAWTDPGLLDTYSLQFVWSGTGGYSKTDTVPIAAGVRNYAYQVTGLLGGTYSLKVTLTDATTLAALEVGTFPLTVTCDDNNCAACSAAGTGKCTQCNSGYFLQTVSRHTQCNACLC